MKKLQAVKDKIVVEIIPDDLKTSGGLFIPENVVQLPHSTGRVISFGEEVIGVSEGDIVIFHRFAGGQATYFENKEIRVLCVNEIYGVVKEIE